MSKPVLLGSLLVVAGITGYVLWPTRPAPPPAPAPLPASDERQIVEVRVNGDLLSEEQVTDVSPAGLVTFSLKFSRLLSDRGDLATIHVVALPSEIVAGNGNVTLVENDGYMTGSCELQVVKKPDGYEAEVRVIHVDGFTVAKLPVRVLGMR